MKSKVTIVLATIVLATVLILLSLVGLAGADPLARPSLQGGAPTVVSYQGQVKVNGAAYDGTGYFKFAIVNAAGDTTYWSNDGTASGEPTNAVSLTVSNSLFNVLLGDTSLTNMEALNADVFSGTERYLRVWFSSGSGFTQLSPDRRIAAVPYALQAEEAKSAADADTLDTLDSSAFWQLGGNAGTTLGTDYLGTSDAVSLTLATNGAAAVRIDTAGNVGLGTDSPAERLTVRGNALVLGEDNPVTQSYTNTNLSDPYSVFVSGCYAYVASSLNDRLVIFDVSDPANPVAKGYTSTNLDDPRSVFVSGRYAYVVSYYSDNLAIFDVSDPANPVAKGSTSADLDQPQSVFVAGRYAYVASPPARLAIFDVSDPDNPVAAGWVATYLDRPTSVFVTGRYAYVTSGNNDRLVIFDVSDPTNPVATSRVGAAYLDYPTSVFVSGRYAYVASYSNDRLVIFDVSDPANPLVAGVTSTNLDGPWSVFVAGRYAYVASSENDLLVVFDVSDPTNPVAKGYTTSRINAPWSVFVAGRYAYVASHNNDRLVVFEVNNLEAPAAEVGSLQAGDLQVSGSARVSNGLHVQGSLNVGPGGALVGGDLGVQGDLFTHWQVTTLSASTTLTVTQSGVVLINNAAAATITLPAAASATGLAFTIKRLTANAVTVDTAGGNIDDVASRSLAAQYDFITVISDGTNWYIVAR